MRSSTDFFTVLDGWKQSGAILRSYESRDNGWRELEGSLKVRSVSRSPASVTFWKFEEGREWLLPLGDADVEVAEPDKEIPPSVKGILTGSLVKISISEVGLFVIGELTN